jgi:endonuclease/exonuclease/phosphatase (EEP) superfamily protein YafD
MLADRFSIICSYCGRPFHLVSQLSFYALAIFSLSVVLGLEWYLLDLASHFRVQYLIMLPVLFILKKKRQTFEYLILAAALIVNISALYPLFLGTETSTPIETQAENCQNRLKVLQSNVYAANQNHGEFLNLIAQEKPAIIAIQELTLSLENELNRLELYPYRIAQSRLDSFGIGLYSRYPLTQAQIFQHCPSCPISIEASLKLQNIEIDLGVEHPVPPVLPVAAELRNSQLVSLAAGLKEKSGTAIVMGDLNVSEFSTVFKRLLVQSDLKSVRAGRGLFWSWPTHNPLLAIPIDHILYRGVELQELRKGTKIGSDHYPLIAEFCVFS